jgi:integrase
MARAIRDKKIDTRSARGQLSVRTEPYWARMMKGCYVGYRKPSHGSGSWIARFRDATGRQNFQSISAADDTIEANGVTVLTFDQAQERARVWYEEMALGDDLPRIRGPYTVTDCMTDYLIWATQHRKSAEHLNTYISAFILPQLGKVNTSKLTAAMLRKWHHAIASQPPRLRTGKGQPQQLKAEDPDLAEALRKRRLRANRHLVTLKAALTRAWRDGRIAHNDAWVRIQPFPGTERRRSRFLTNEEARRLLKASPPELRDLVRLALLTGARYGELCTLNVNDFQSDAGTLFVRDSKSGKPRHIILNDEGAQFCRQAILGRPGEEPLLRRTNGGRWSRDHHRRPFKEAVARAGLDQLFTFHELRHTWASLTIMAGAPLMVVAQNLGHRDTRMVELHYGHLADSFVRRVIRETAPSFGLVDDSRVVPIRG